MSDVPVLPAALREQYSVERTLGRGGMGTVILATDRRLGRKVAIKVLPPLERPEYAARLAREAAILARLSHPALPQVYELGESERGPFLVMEYLVGRSLDHLGPDDMDGLEVMMAAAEGLQAVHDQDMVHRDVKPGNILLADDGRVVLVDFGLALDPSRTRLTSTGVVGTPLYLAPEVLLGSRTYSPASDWYAWGVTLHRVLEGSPAFAPVEIMASISNPKRPWPTPVFLRTDSDAPPAKLVRACTGADPDRRPADLVEIRALLEGRSRPAVVAPAPASPAEQPGPASTLRLPRVSVSSPGHEAAPRTRAWPAFGLALLALVMSVGAVWTLRQEDAPFLPEADPPTPPPASSPPEPGPPPDPHAPPSVDLGPTLDAEFSALGELRVTRDGRVVAAGSYAPDADPFLDPDPLVLPEILGRLPADRKLLDWLARGGYPEELPAELVAAMRAVDARHAARELLPPFEPYLEVRPPSGPVTIDTDGMGPDGGGPRTMQGWSAAAGLAFVEALQVYEELEQEYRDSGGSPIGGGRLHLGDFLGMQRVDRYLAGIVTSPDTRMAVVRWVSRGVPATRRALYAAGRALRDEPDQALPHATLFWGTVRKIRPFYFSGLAALPADLLLGGPPTTPGGRLLAAEVVEKAALRFELMGGDTGERLHAVADLVRPVLDVPGDDPTTRLLRLRALDRLVDNLGRYHDVGALRTVAETRQDLLREGGGTLIHQTHLHLLRFATGEKGRGLLSPEALTTLRAAGRARLAAAPEDPDNGALREAVEALEEQLAAGGESDRRGR